LRLRAPAKVNLSLAVLGTLPDGYHRVHAVLQAVSLWDEVTLRPRRRGITITCDDPDIPTDEHNLCHRAAMLVMPGGCLHRGVAVHLRKRIPAQAGLGGGSSDAAATLVGLNWLWGLGLRRYELARLAARLGADVPFFIRGGCAVGAGRGDEVTRLGAGPAVHLVLARAGVGVPTPWAYGRCEPGAGRRAPRVMLRAVESGSPAAVARALRNDLERAVLPARPDIAELKARLLEHGALGALMAGSGCAVFGIFSTHKAAQETAAAMSKEGVWARAVRSIGSGASFIRGKGAG
jgi:4-diphosphocytidyl-2-C-methyl-D-erythritol kinase